MILCSLMPLSLNGFFPVLQNFDLSSFIQKNGTTDLVLYLFDIGPFFQPPLVPFLYSDYLH